VNLYKSVSHFSFGGEILSHEHIYLIRIVYFYFVYFPYSLYYRYAFRMRIRRRF